MQPDIVLPLLLLCAFKRCRDPRIWFARARIFELFLRPLTYFFLTNLGSRNPTVRSVQAEFIKLNEVSVAPSTAPIERTIAVEDLHFYLINVDQDKKYVSRIFAITSKTVAKLENYL